MNVELSQDIQNAAKVAAAEMLAKELSSKKILKIFDLRTESNYLSVRDDKSLIYFGSIDFNNQRFFITKNLRF